MQEYSLAKGWKIATFIIAPLLIIVFLWLLVMPFVPGKENEIPRDAYWFLMPISLGMIAFMVYAIMDAIMGKLIIEQHKLVHVGVFSTRELRFDEIDGFRVDDKYISIEPKHRDLKPLKVSVYYEKADEIVEWLDLNFANLNEEDIENEADEIRYNDEYGDTLQDKEDLFKKAYKMTKILNWASGILGICLFFGASRMPDFIVYLSMTLPIVVAWEVKSFKGMIRIHDNDKSIYPNVFYAFIGISFGLGLLALRDYNIQDYTNMWAPVILLTIALVGFTIYGNKVLQLEKFYDYIMLLMFSVIIFFWSFGTIILLNCKLDTSEITTYNATILQKRVSSGKSKTCYFELTPWGDYKESKDVQVSRDLYKSREVNDKVDIRFREGRFGIKWFVVY